VGCIAGAIELDKYTDLLKIIGIPGEYNIPCFLSLGVVFVGTLNDLNVYYKYEVMSVGKCCSAELLGNHVQWTVTQP
jgi:hypothetical protein